MATLKGQSSFELSVVTKTKEEPIGVGSYASVYEVIVHETVCAAKEMHPILVNTEDSKWKSVFLAECENCSKILHPNIVQFLGIYYPNARGKKAKLPWLVMELMHISLTGLIEKYEKEDIPLHFKFSIFLNVCQGLQFLHSQNIIHRDLYSSNILLTKHLVAKISDLGMAKMISPGFSRHTQTPGNMVFMPPEALSINPVYGTPIDVFSLGCVCVHVTSMQWPTPKDRVTENDVVLSEVQRREYLFVKMSEIPALRRLVESCLQKKPEDRPVIGEVITALKGIEYSHSPHEGDNIIDLFNAVMQHEVSCKKAIIEKDQVIAQQTFQLQSKDQALKQKDEELSTKDKELSMKDQLIKQLQTVKLPQKDQVIAQQTFQLQSKDQALKQKDEELSMKDQLIKQLRTVKLPQKDQELQLANKALSQQTRELEHKNNQLLQNKQQICQLQQELEYQNHQLSEIDKILKWRFTKDVEGNGSQLASSPQQMKQVDTEIRFTAKHKDEDMSRKKMKQLLKGSHKQMEIPSVHTIPLPAHVRGGTNETAESKNCPICFESLKSMAPTAVTCCKHCKQGFCKSCLDEAMKYKPYCPTCTLPLRKITGNQLRCGTMSTHIMHECLPGYEKYATICIRYDIPGGKQGPEHPNPGIYFNGKSCPAYLPNSPEGQKVARLLKKAFDAGLVFTVGTSHTTGAKDTVVWNDIHHKTNTHGGPESYGYPDPTYLNRVTEELAAKGIKE